MGHTRRVTTPVAGFSGVVAGVAFADGAAETSNRAALAYFRRHGYGIAPAESVKPARKLRSKPAGSGEPTE